MAKGKEVKLTDEELKQIVQDSVNNAVETFRKEQEAQRKTENDRKLHNTKILLENYQKFKAFLAYSACSLEEITVENNPDCDIELLKIFGLREVDKKSYSLAKSVANTTIIMEHVDRMLEVYRKSCEGSPSIVVQRRWQVVERMYLREQRMTTTQIAEEFNLEPRNIREDAKRAREDLKVLFFGIESIVTEMV